MKNFGQKLYSNMLAKTNKAVNNEEGSQAVEFMGIAAVVIIVIVILTTWMGDSGKSGFESILDGVISLVGGWFGGK